jgi:hypothetical protein
VRVEKGNKEKILTGTSVPLDLPANGRPRTPALDTPLGAHCQVGLGKLYRRIGSRQQAEEHLTTAIAMMREVEMGLWLKQAEAELKELG